VERPKTRKTILPLNNTKFCCFSQISKKHAAINPALRQPRTVAVTPHADSPRTADCLMATAPFRAFYFSLTLCQPGEYSDRAKARHLAYLLPTLLRPALGPDHAWVLEISAGSTVTDRILPTAVGIIQPTHHFGVRGDAVG
jgi:hypothetical protein